MRMASNPINNREIGSLTKQSPALIFPPSSNSPVTTEPAATDRENRITVNETCVSSGKSVQPSCAEQNETGPYSPADLVLIPHQPPYAAVNTRHTMDAASPRNPLPPSLPPAPRGCGCGCFGCTTFCQSYIRSASYAPAVEDSTKHDHITGCQLNPRWTTVPVHESLIGYAGPSALVC